MKDEIKIITLGDIFKNLETEEKAFKFKNYITNLQEENERLAIELNKNMIERNNYLSRNEKAIEFIKEKGCYYSGDFDDILDLYDLNDLLNILNGGDEE